MPYASTPGNPDLCHQDRMGSNRDIVGNLDQIVDFSPLLDDRLAKCGAIDRDIRSDLDIILNRDSAELRNFVMLSLILHIAESVAANHRATVNDDPRSDGTRFPDDDVGIQHRIVPNDRIVTDEDAGIEGYSSTDCYPVSQGDSWPDRGIGTDLSVSTTDN